MVEAPSQVRDALAQTRTEVAETIHALGERVDAARSAAEAVADEAERILSAAGHATSKVADFGQHALGSAATQLKATRRKPRALLPMLIAALAVGTIALFVSKHRKAVTEESLEWDTSE
jgi:hypothetical protein